MHIKQKCSHKHASFRCICNKHGSLTWVLSVSWCCGVICVGIMSVGVMWLCGWNITLPVSGNILLDVYRGDSALRNVG